METTQNKLKMTIEKDGKILKYVETNPSHSGQAGFFTDKYKDEDGNIHYIDRMANAIKFTTHSRRTGDGNMVSFVINFKNLINGAISACDSKELETLIKKCEYSLSKAKEGYLREDKENGNNNYQEAVKTKVSQSIDEFTLKEKAPAYEQALERISNSPRMNEQEAFKNAICLKLEEMRKEEELVDVEEEPTLE